LFNHGDRDKSSDTLSISDAQQSHRSRPGLQFTEGIENSLIVKLQNDQNSLAAGDTASVCESLTAFINQVNAQAGKALTTDRAIQLIARAGQIRAVLGCQ